MRFPFRDLGVSDAAKLGLKGQPIPAVGETQYELLLQSVDTFAFTTPDDFGPFTEVDSGGNVAVADGVLKVKGNGAAWDVNGVYLTTPVLRSTPGAFRIKVTPKAADGSIVFGGTDISNNYMLYFGAGSLKFIQSGPAFGVATLWGSLILYWSALVVGTQYEFEFRWKDGLETVFFRVVGVSAWTELCRAYSQWADRLSAGFQINCYTAYATPWEFDDYERLSGYATDGPTRTYGADAGENKTFDGWVFANLAAVGSWATTNAKFKYSFDDGTPSYNASWLSLAELNGTAALTTRKRYARLMVQVNSDGATQQYAGEINADDATAGGGDYPDVGNVLPADTVQLATGTSDKLYSAAEEASRNTDPGAAYVLREADGGPASYKILNDPKTPAYNFTAAEAARNNDNGTVAGDIKTGKSVKIRNATTSGTFAIVAPAQPTASAARLTDTSMRVTVDGDAGVTNYVEYADMVDLIWKAGGSCSGDGNVDIASLTSGHTYLVAAYSLHSSGGISEWSDVAFHTAGPAAGSPTGAYTTFISALKGAVQGSAALAAVITDGLPAAHVKFGRFVHTDATALADVLAKGPVVYVRYVPYRKGPLTHENSRGSLTAELTVVQGIDQSASDDLTTPSNFVEALTQELMSGIEGSGASWSARAFGLACEVGEPQMVAHDMLATVVRIPAGYTEAI